MSACATPTCHRVTLAARSIFCRQCREAKRRLLAAAHRVDPGGAPSRAAAARETAQIEATLARVKAERKYARAMGRAG